jgi:iron complex transport system ATP-binding protein
MQRFCEFNTSDLSIGYAKSVVLQGINLHIGESKLILLAGRNGSGKSTLLRTILGFLSPIEGEIFMDHQKLNSLSPLQKAKIFSYVAARPLFMNDFTVRQIVESGRAPYTPWSDMLSPSDKSFVHRAFEYLNIQHISECKMDAISDGERQKAMIARALAQDTPYILLDEPTAFLDYPAKTDFIRTIKMLKTEFDKTIVLSSHDLDHIIPAADEIWFCHNRQLIVDSVQNMSTKNEFQLFYTKN